MEVDISSNKSEALINVGFIGIFKGGTTTLINSLLGKELLVSDVLPCTAVPTFVRYGKEVYAEIFYKNETNKKIKSEELKTYTTSLTGEVEKVSETVERVDVYFPHQFGSGIQLLDIPGLNNDLSQDSIALNTVKKMDIVVWNIPANHPIDTYEIDCLSVALAQGKPNQKFIITINHFDQLTDDFVKEFNKAYRHDYVRIPPEGMLDGPFNFPMMFNRYSYITVKTIQRIIGELTKARDSVALFYESFPEIYQNAIRKLMNAEIIPVSGKMALKSQKTNDKDMLIKSNIPALEKIVKNIQKNFTRYTND